jgi:hypothetical protein
MTHSEATEIVIKYEPILVGKPFIAGNQEPLGDIKIKGLLISPISKIGKLIDSWNVNGNNNESALLSIGVPLNSADLEVFVYSYNNAIIYSILSHQLRHM